MRYLMGIEIVGLEIIDAQVKLPIAINPCLSSSAVLILPFYTQSMLKD